MNKRTRCIVVCVIVCVVVSLGLYAIISQKSTLVTIEPHTLYDVVEVMDGDTLRVKVNHKVITVRLLGINTPETVDPRRGVGCFGPEASKQTKELLTGQKIFLALNPKREVLDRYGRYLAYIYREDGLFINEKLLTEGYAREYTYGSPYSLQKEFKSLEKKAKVAQKGLWGTCV
jgi:micrococcal nuclease